MAAITQIRIRIHTSTKTNAGTDGHVYFAVCGREFHLNRPGDDFIPGSNTTYILGGNEANTDSADRPFNDPTNPQLDTNELNSFPAWIRFEPTGESPDWNLEEVELTLISGGTPITYVAPLLANNPDLWLGQRLGEFCFLRRRT